MCIYCRYVLVCSYREVLYVCVGISMYLQVFFYQYNLHTYTYWLIPTYSDIPTYRYRYCMSVCCRYFFQIPTDMAPTFSHTYTYLLTGSLMMDQVRGGKGGAGGKLDSLPASSRTMQLKQANIQDKVCHTGIMTQLHPRGFFLSIRPGSSAGSLGQPARRRESAGQAMGRALETRCHPP